MMLAGTDDSQADHCHANHTAQPYDLHKGIFAGQELTGGVGHGKRYGGQHHVHDAFRQMILAGLRRTH